MWALLLLVAFLLVKCPEYHNSLVLASVSSRRFRRLKQQIAPAVTCCWNKTFLQQPKPSTFCIMFNVTLIFYPHHTGMRPELLYTNGSFEISQERMFVKQRRTYDWSTYLLSKKTFMLKQKSSNLSIIGFNSVRNFLSDCLSTFH